ncbi:hypothetical protein GBAR_LOCUS30829 [Geodia barretti]|uniref:Uncharacterized protein n=1 Tax=Geodia barretti TaxID=519541 RepID=A0AA35XKW4_GEOBA|nr:hypothetical protein GBAR_LOCUS30829 [Geodia barretti]
MSCVCVCWWGRYNEKYLTNVIVTTAWLDAKTAKEFGISFSVYPSQKDKRVDKPSTSSSSSSRDADPGKRQRNASESDRSQVNSHVVVSPGGNGTRTSDSRSRQNSVSSQEIDEGKGEGGGDPSERPESRVSSHSRGSGESNASKTIRKEKIVTHSSSETYAFTQYHSSRRPSNNKWSRNSAGGGRETRKRRASSPATSYDPLTKRTREDRVSVDGQKGNIFSRLGPSSYARSKDRRVVDGVSESSPPLSHGTRSRGQDSSQASSERSQSPASQECSGSPARSLSRSRGHSERGDERKREGSSPSSRSRGAIGRSKSEREENIEKRRDSYNSRYGKKASERDHSRRIEEEEEEEEGGRGRAASVTRRRRKKSDHDSESDREGNKSSGWRVKNVAEKTGGSPHVTKKIEREICNISWDEAETTADEMETPIAEQTEDSAATAVSSGGESQVELKRTEEEEKKGGEGTDSEKKDVSQPLPEDKDVTESAVEEGKDEGGVGEGEGKGLDTKTSSLETGSGSKPAEKDERKKADDSKTGSSQPAEVKESRKAETTRPKSQGRPKRGKKRGERVDISRKIEVGAVVSLQPNNATSDESRKTEQVNSKESSKSDANKVEVRAKTPPPIALPPIAPPTSRDYTERDVTPPLEVLQSMQQQAPFQPPFFPVPFPITSSPHPLSTFHPSAHLFPGQHPVGGASLPIPGMPLSFPPTISQRSMAGGIVMSSGVWPVHMAPAPWQQIWLNPHQRALGAGATPVNDDSSTDTDAQSTATTTQTAEPKDQSEARTPEPQNSVETDTTLEETSKTVPASSPKPPPPDPIPLNSSTATSACRVTVTEGTQTMGKDEVNSDVATADQGNQTSPNGSLEGQLEGEREGGKRRRRVDAKSKLPHSEMMETFRQHASVLALSTKLMIR